MNVLLIEDDIQLNTTITNFLKSINYEVTSLRDGEVAINTIDNKNFNLFIIDINLPNINGLDIVKYIRLKDSTTAIIMITASMELDNLKNAFKNGCNEYIKKPFFLEELELRINNLLKNQNEDSIKISNNISFDIKYEELIIEGRTIQLRKKEKKLLSLFLQNVNHTVDTEQIQNFVWENEIKETYPLRQLVNELRKKFDNGEKFIFSNPGIGYRFEINS